MHTEPITFDQLDYAQDLDERVVCNGCPHSFDRTEKESVHLDKAKVMRAAGKRLGFDGDKIEQQGEWVSISWRAVACKLGQHLTPPIHPMPAGVLHRCSFVKPPGYAEMHQPKETLQRAAKRATEASSAKASKDWWE